MKGGSREVKEHKSTGGERTWYGRQETLAPRQLRQRYAILPRGSMFDLVWKFPWHSAIWLPLPITFGWEVELLNCRKRRWEDFRIASYLDKENNSENNRLPLTPRLYPRIMSMEFFGNLWLSFTQSKRIHVAQELRITWHRRITAAVIEMMNSSVPL